ncbi:MAG: hypothetical protein MRZ79_21460 [Bacteroidia bacterium]|nr:hypothetical protein [Bacteroidia bacterium]
MLNTERSMEGLRIFQDFKDSSLYYYVPPPLQLKIEKSGRPSFQFLAMRYTGSSCRANEGGNEFLSVAQFTIQRPLADKNQIYQVERSLRQQTGNWVRLKPIPLAGIGAELVAPVGSNPNGHPQNRRLGGVNISENGPSEWEEKTFTLKLNPHEAQLLIQNMEKEQLSISFSYTYLASAIPGISNSLILEGDSSSRSKLQELKEDVTADSDTTVGSHVVFGNTLEILADVNTWPQNLKKVDVNADGFPVGFPSLELRCYDFADGLRPDLAIKRVSLQAYTLGGQLSRPINYQFSAQQTFTIEQQVNFPVVLDMSRGYRYQITEIKNDGSISKSNGWTEANFCEGLLDLTTNPDQNPIAHQVLEVELSQEDMEKAGFVEAKFILNFSFAGNEKVEEIRFGKNSYESFQSLDIAFDKAQGYSVKVIWIDGNGDKITKRVPSHSDGYYYLSIE